MGRTHEKIGVLDHLGGGNLGDDATLDAVKQNIQSRWPDATIFAFSLNPRDTEIRHGIPSYAIRTQTWTLGATRANNKASFKEVIKTTLSKYGLLLRVTKALNTVVIRVPRSLFQEILFLAKSFQILRSFDLLIISGGGQLTDWGGPWLFPYTIFKWIALAKAARVNRVFLNVGAGPLNRPLSRFFVRHALRSATYVSFRDKESRALVQQIGFRGRAQVFPDCVYGLLSRTPSTSNTRRSSRPIVGIAPMPYFDPRGPYPDKDQGAYDRFIRTLASFGSRLVRDNFSLNLFCSDIGIDPPVIKDLANDLLACYHTDARYITASSVESTDQLLSAMASMEYVVTCRFHGVVFAHTLNKPVIAISHHPKISTLMKELGMSKYCVDIRTCSADTLTELFLSLVTNEEAIKSRMAEKLALYRREVGSQFDSIFPPRHALAAVGAMELKDYLSGK